MVQQGTQENYQIGLPGLSGFDLSTKSNHTDLAYSRTWSRCEMESTFSITLVSFPRYTHPRPKVINWVRHSSSLSGLIEVDTRRTRPKNHGVLHVISCVVIRPHSMNIQYLILEAPATFTSEGAKQILLSTYIITVALHICGQKSAAGCWESDSQRWLQMLSRTSLFLLIAAQTALPPPLHITNRDPIPGKGHPHLRASIAKFPCAIQHLSRRSIPPCPLEFVLPVFRMKTWTGWQQGNHWAVGGYFWHGLHYARTDLVSTPIQHSVVLSDSLHSPDLNSFKVLQNQFQRTTRWDASDSQSFKHTQGHQI